MLAMKRRQVVLAVTAIAAAFVVSACENFYSDQPKTYEECISKNMQGVTNARTRILVEKGCRTQFPER